MKGEYAIPVVSIMGGGAQADELLDAIARELMSRGRRVGIVRRAQGGAAAPPCGGATVATVSDAAVEIIQPCDAPPPLMHVVDQYFTLSDVVLTRDCVKEGVGRIYTGGGDAAAEDDDFIAVSEGAADAPRLADLIVEKYLAADVSRSELRLWVNGKFVVVKPFVKAFIGQAVKGMLSSLRGGKNAEKIHIKIGR